MATCWALYIWHMQSSPAHLHGSKCHCTSWAFLQSKTLWIKLLNFMVSFEMLLARNLFWLLSYSYGYFTPAVFRPGHKWSTKKSQILHVICLVFNAIENTYTKFTIFHIVSLSLVWLFIHLQSKSSNHQQTCTCNQACRHELSWVVESHSHNTS